MNDITKQLQTIFGDKVKLDEPMSKHTNFRIGGPAKWYLEVSSKEELLQALNLAQENDVRVVIHGGGSNVLYADGGVEALVIVPALREMCVESLCGGSDCKKILSPEPVEGLKSDSTVSPSTGSGNNGGEALGNNGDEAIPLNTKEIAASQAPRNDECADSEQMVIVQAGVPSVVVARKSVEAGLEGLEWMITLPGTVGGAVRGNAGCFGGETGDRLESVEVLRMEDGGWIFSNLDAQDLKMSYRHSILKEPEGKDWIITEVVFELEKGDKKALKQKLEQLVTKRKDSQPTNVGSAGCTFKNYDIKTDEELDDLKQKLDIPEPMLESRRLAAGWIIDQLGLKGQKIGGAQVSEVHGNFLVNDESATADHIMQLIAFIKTRARDEFGIQLEEEIQYIM